jgi:integrase
MLRCLSPALRWATEEDLIPGNFVGDLRKLPTRKRTRILAFNELAAIWHACGKFRGGSARSYARLVRFLMLTGARRSEAAGIRYGHVCNGIWLQTDNKSSRPHLLPLPRMALDLLGEGTAGDLCFPGRGGPVSGFGKFKLRLDEGAGVTGWILHDLRRTLVSGLADLGVDEMTIRSVINHAVTTGTLSHYLHAALEEQRRVALQRWVTELQKAIDVAGQRVAP